MTKTRKFLTLIVAFVICIVSFVALSTRTEVKAAEAGTLVSNAISLTSGKWCTKYWTNQNYSLNCYNKIVVPSRGYITLTVQKPFDSEGEICSYDIILYNPQGDVVWDASTAPQRDSFNEYYVYKIGLAAGTYYMNLDPNFYVYSTSAPIPSKYKYVFTKTAYWEVESNNDKSTATQLTLGKTYNGVYQEENSAPRSDYYKVKLTKGKFYCLTIGNYNELDAGTCMIDFRDPNNEYLLYGIKESGNSKFKIFKASCSGWYYLKLHNALSNPGVEYTVKVAEHIKKAQTISGPSKITVYGYDDFNISKYKYSAKTELAYTENSSILSIRNGKIDPSDSGTATITIKAAETDYYKAATKKVTVVINPAGTTMKSLTNNKRGGLEVKFETPYYSGVSTQVQIATNKNFTKNVKNHYVKNGGEQITIKNLKAGTTYYVRTRNIDTVNGKKYYSKWSKTLSKKVTVSIPRVNISSAYSWSWAEGKLEVEWYSVDNVAGYQVQISTNNKFTKNLKTKNIYGSDYLYTEHEFTKLTSGKKYYVRVRAFVKTGGKMHYGSWSNIKNDIIS